MRIKTLLGTTILASSLLTQAVLPANASSSTSVTAEQRYGDTTALLNEALAPPSDPDGLRAFIQLVTRFGAFVSGNVKRLENDVIEGVIQLEDADVDGHENDQIDVVLSGLADIILEIAATTGETTVEVLDRLFDPVNGLFPVEIDSSVNVDELWHSDIGSQIGSKLGDPNELGFYPKKGTSFDNQFKIVSLGNGISGKFHIIQPTESMPWAFSVNVSATGLSDNRVDSDVDADIWSVTGNGTVRIDDKTVFGAALTYREGDVESITQNTTLDGQNYGLSLFVSRQITRRISLAAYGGYTHGENNIDLDGATGSFNSNTFNAGLQAFGQYNLNGYNFIPDAGFGISRKNNDGFLSSNGVFSNATRITSFTASVGGTLSKSFSGKGGMVFTPTFGLHGIYENKSGENLELLDGSSLSNDLGLGVTVSPGINITMANGATLGFDASYTQYQEDVSSWTVGGKLSIPLN